MHDLPSAARVLRRCLPLLLPLLFACATPSNARAGLGALSAPSPGPCCEREPIYDLFAAPYRRGER